VHPAMLCMNLERAGGILLHPTSLPGPHGIGDLGPESEAWLEWLAQAGCRLWQVLPLGPTGYGDSPYQSFSAFAGNPLLVSIERLVDEGLLAREDLASLPEFPPVPIDFGALIPHRQRLLALASERFRQGTATHLASEFEEFCREQTEWLEDFALFMALKAEHGGAAWTSWEPAVAHRQPEALAAAGSRLSTAVADHRFCQFLFFRQWASIRRLARSFGLSIIGDLPIFVAHDSADVWSHPELFDLDAEGKPTSVAGVPPDYFSPTGQLWGNPLYRWEAMQADGYSWWLHRFRVLLQLVDVVRLDHFRGFEAFWEVPAGEPTAETGRWAPGPGAGFFERLSRGLGGLPIIAEDLGKITPQVIALRDRFMLPGMRVLQFAFAGEPAHDFLPHNYPRRCVVYTGTHDNDTALGWYQTAPEAERDFCRRYLAVSGSDISWDLIRAAWASVADWAIVPLQDLLGLGGESRMNYPSRPEGNWSWRFLPGQLTAELAGRLEELSYLYGRASRETEEDPGSQAPGRLAV
jgi:4-alpha-glucanotransferase